MKLVLIFSLGILTACASGPCNNQIKNSEPVPAVAPQSASTSAAVDSSKVKVAKSDGGRQCSQGKAVALDVMGKQLTAAGIKILSSAKQSDGMMHTQVCGSSTGVMNAYEINSADLIKAEKLGFKRLEL